MGSVFVYHNLEGDVPYLLLTFGLAFFISQKRGLILVNNKKNIGLEVERLGNALKKKREPIKETLPLIFC